MPSRRATERFVDFKALDIVQLPTRARQCDLHGGHRTEAEHARLDRRDPIRDEPRERLDTARFGETPLGHQHRGRAAVQPRRVARGDRAVRAEGRTQSGERLHGRVRARLFIARELLRTFARGDIHRYQLGVEVAARLRVGKTLLRARGPTVLGFARDVELTDEVFRMPARMLAGKRVVQAVAQQAVVNLRVTHPIPPAPAIEQVRCAIHVLHTARDGGIAKT
jgi:hypothetical protein